MFRVARGPVNAPSFVLVTTLTGMGVVFHVVCDANQSLAPRFPLTPLLCTSVLFVLASVVLTVRMGFHAYPSSFRVYQPFLGGDTFTAMQILGYLAFGSGVLVDFGYWKLSVHDGRGLHPGILSVAGVLLGSSVALLVGSLDHFEPPRHHHATQTLPPSPRGRPAAVASPSLLQRLLPSRTDRSTVLVLVCATLGNALPPIVALLFPPLMSICFVVQLVLHVLCAGVLHVYLGWCCTPKYRLFMPFPEGSVKVGFTQAFAWLTFSVALQGSVLLARAGSDAPFALVVGTTSTSFISICSLLLFVRMWPFQRARSQSTSTTSYFIVKHGKFTASVVALTDALFIISVSLVLLMSPEAIRDVLWDGWRLTDAVAEGLRVCQFVSALFLLALPPLTHAMGVLLFPKHFDLWAPFSGSKGYIALQALGWICYTASLFVGVTALTFGPAVTIAFACAAAFAQLFMHASLHVFEPADPLFSRELSPVHHTSSPPSFPVASHPAVNGELLLALLLAAGGCALRITIDLMGDGAPRNELLWFSVATLFLAAPVAHISTRDRQASLFAPFRGPSEYVALQAVGWTLYAIFAILAGMSLAEGQPLGMLSWSADAVLQVIPLCIIVLSAFVLPPAASTNGGAGGGGGGSPITSPRRERRPTTTTTEIAASAGLVPRRSGAATVDQAPAEACDGNVNNSSSSGSSNGNNSRVARSAEELLSALRKAHRLTPELKLALLPLTLAPAAGGRPDLLVVDDEPVSGSNGSESPRQPAGTRERIQGIAAVVVAALSIAQFALHLLAAYFSTIPSRGASAAVLSVAAILCNTMTCFGLHAVYGPLQNQVGYLLYMPFAGGSPFVVLQACGWGCYTASALLGLSFVLKSSSASSFVLSLTCGGVLGVTAQFLILKSVDVFACRTATKTGLSSAPSLLEAHAEGALAFLLFVGTFAFQHLVARSPLLGGDPLSPVAMMFSSTSILLALPLAVVALRKATAMHDSAAAMENQPRSPTTIFSERDSPSGTPKKHNGRRAVDRNHSLSGDAAAPQEHHRLRTPSSSDYFMIPFVSLFPIAMVYIVYFAVNRYTDYAHVVLDTVLVCFYGFMTVILGVISTAALSTRTTVPEWLLGVRSAAATCSLYMIPTMIVLPSYIFPLAFPCRATFLWALTITLFTIIPPPFNRKVLRPLLGGYIGWWWYAALAWANPYVVAAWEHPTSVTDVVALLVDLGTPCFWFLYSFTFSGRPEEHGYRRSPKFIAFMKRYFFDEAVKYFHLRVLAEPEMHGRLRESSETFLFGFHPHGVFPATASYLAETDSWKEQLGSNTRTYVTCHGATILFNGPLLRDFVMATGGRSVTRRGIEQSLDEGNHPLVVIGGQAELILTAKSTEELHLVTHHQGLFRIAARKGVAVVPIVVLGEHNIMENLRWYKTQRWFLKLLGFPFPLIPLGRWGLPIPHKTCLTAAVGRPVYPPGGFSDSSSSAAIDAFSAAYYAEVMRLFDTRRSECGMSNITLHLHHGLPRTDPRKPPNTNGSNTSRVPPEATKKDLRVPLKTQPKHGDAPQQRKKPS